MLQSKYVFFTLLLLGCTAISLNFPAFNPPERVAPYLDGIFPAVAPGGTWELAEPMPDLVFSDPVRIKPFPNSDDILILGKRGQLWRVNVAAQDKELVLDIRDRSFKKGDGGTVGFALHPKFGDSNFPDQQHVFVYYRTKPEPDRWSEMGFNRLSKFTWSDNTQEFLADSEEILFQQFDRSTWHDGGSLLFGRDEFLYFSVGDEGQAEFQNVSNQRLDGGFFGGVFRIDVDKDPTRSHPIRRQPQANAAPPTDWGGETFSQGYFIPNDNPWQNADGEVLEEYYALGLRSPFAMALDPDRDFLWVADVGSSFREEINHVEKGDNLQWPYLEGTVEIEGHSKPEPFIGNEKGVYKEYERTFGACIIGGEVYRGTKFPELNGKYLFADFTTNRVMALINNGSQTEPEIETLINDLGGQAVVIPEQPAITGIFVIQDGRVLITVFGGRDNEQTGRIFELKRKTAVEDPPARLSQLGVFTNLERLTPRAGIIPYRVNSPLWSDRAVKQRWMILPNDGTFDSQDEQIVFNNTEDWKFPAGTVFIKHFEMPTDLVESELTQRLETRFFIIGENGVGYGLTYQWNDEGTEAFLLGGGASKDFSIYENGEYVYTQTWDYPSREQCLTCHNANANYTLGVNTHQLNGDLYYHDLNEIHNQLEYLDKLNVFTTKLVSAEQYLRAYGLTETEADLGTRIRSYLDANCASCHRLGGTPTVTMDLRLNKPLPLQNIINFPTQSHSSNPHLNIVQPGSHADSELWIRDQSQSGNRMPPLGRNLVDENYIVALAEWIDGLPENFGQQRESRVFPNPTNGWLGIRLNDEWEGPFYLTLHSMNGQLVREQVERSGAIYLELNDLPKGSYVLKIEGGSTDYVEQIVLN